MLHLPRRFALAAFVAAALPASAAAQLAACSVDLYKPAQLAQATVFIQRAAEAPEGEAGAKALRDAANVLRDERRFASNPTGLAFVKAQIFVLWLHQDEPPTQMSLADLNFGRDRNTMVNLIDAVDSLLTQVEKAAPDCEDEIDRWRQSRPWNERIGAAYRLLGEGKLDDAEVLAKEAFKLDRRSPFIYNAFAQIAARRGDRAEMFKQLDIAIELSAKDTSMAETSRQLRTQYASTLQEMAAAEADATKRKETFQRAARMFLAIGLEDPTAQDGPAYFSAAMDIAMLTQDQELLADILTPMLEDPLPFPDIALLIGAETSRMLNRADDAMTLYRAALDKNANIRDANYFLSYMLIDAKKPSEAGPMLDKLLEVDPGNPDNYLMKTMAVRAVAEAERDVRKRAELIRQVEALMKQEAELPHRVQITRFERRAEGAVLSGSVENRARQAKAYTLQVSFLDVEGNVLETVNATTAQAAANETVTFEVTAKEPGIAAWKYVIR